MMQDGEILQNKKKAITHQATMKCKQPQLTVSFLRKKRNQEFLGSDTYQQAVDQVLSWPVQEIWQINLITIAKLFLVIVRKKMLPIRFNLYKTYKMKQFLNSISQILFITNEILEVKPNGFIKM